MEDNLPLILIGSSLIFIFVGFFLDDSKFYIFLFFLVIALLWGLERYINR